MDSYQQARLTFYRTLSNSSGAYQDVERLYFLQQLGLNSSTQSNHDLLRLIFIQLGYTTGTIADRWYKYLGDEGYVGPLRQRQLAFFKNGVGFDL